MSDITLDGDIGQFIKRMRKKVAFIKSAAIGRSVGNPMTISAALSLVMDELAAIKKEEVKKIKAGKKGAGNGT